MSHYSDKSDSRPLVPNKEAVFLMATTSIVTIHMLCAHISVDLPDLPFGSTGFYSVVPLLLDFKYLSFLICILTGLKYP